MTANKPETVLYRAPTFSLLLVSHGGLVCVCVCVCVCACVHACVCVCLTTDHVGYHDCHYQIGKYECPYRDEENEVDSSHSEIPTRLWG